jgi:hypothetical protein
MAAGAAKRTSYPGRGMLEVIEQAGLRVRPSHFSIWSESVQAEWAAQLSM